MPDVSLLFFKFFIVVYWQNFRKLDRYGLLFPYLSVTYGYIPSKKP